MSDGNKNNNIDDNKDLSLIENLKNDFTKQLKSEVSKLSKTTTLKTKLIIIVVALVIVITVLGVTFSKLFGSNKKLTIITESALTDVIETNNLSTLEFTYNAIVTVKSDDEKQKDMYYVAYEGLVTAGINMDDITINVKGNKIEIILPNATIQSVDVNAGTMEYIFVKSKYDDENVPSEAYIKCKTDLENRAKTEDDLLKIAKENAISSISALIEPWINEINDNYTVEVR